MPAEPKTLQEALVYFADPVNCREYLVERRWPGGVACPRCGSKDVTLLEADGQWQCRSRHGSPRFTLRTGTIMEESPLGLGQWLTTMWQIVNCAGSMSPRCSGFQKKICNMLGKRLHADCQRYDLSYPHSESELEEFALQPVGGGATGLKPRYV